ncbi:unnamed protein product [Euphydryas editha]|uniref:Uncharacterized protein n=1 Tax=Euphydryas editha TaxID=104508 RepID=A0AAU9UDL8_EUPED|nr:unnamed protein product [Euphydryas editha]
MESHILNVYHQAPYRGIGHKIMRSTSESLSSESSCNQNSPEYTMSQKTSQYEEESNEGEFWNRRDSHHVWTNNQNVNITQTNIDTSIVDENMEISLDFIDDNNSESDDYETALQNMRDSSLVEGHDYEVIQVIAVDPHLDLEASSEEEEEEEEDDNINEDDQESENGENVVYEHETPCHTHNISQESLGINFDSHVVTNVDEYFIKHNDNNLMEVKNDHVVNDIDEYFIKETKKPETSNVDDYFIKEELPEESDFRISKTVSKSLEVFDNNSTNLVKEQQNKKIRESEDNVAEVSINESDLEVLPNIEDLKRFLLEDMPYNKLKNAQKTYSVSLPHSPMHNLCLDIDAKTCLSFEDLNLDLSDISFENDKEKFGTNVKIEDVPRTLTEEDVNSFLITDKTGSKEVVKNEDDFNLQDMDMDRPVDSIIYFDPVSHLRLNDRKFTSTPIPAPNVLEYCIEKTPVKKEPDIKLEVDDFVDVESCPDTVVPVLEANNLDSLLEQFEATEKLNKDRKPIVNVETPKANSYNLTSGMRLQDAGIQLNKTKINKIMMPSKVNTIIKKSPSPLRSDHDYCSPKKHHSLPNSKGGRSLLKPEVLSSNSRILNSRHRSCKNKKVVYHLSSDDETECNDKKKIKLDSNRIRNESDIKTNKRSCIKASVKPPVNTSSVNSLKKISHAHSVSNDSGLTKNNDSVIVKNASKAVSDNSSSQKSNNCSIKLTIKNKSEVIIQNCDARDLNKNSSHEKSKSSKPCSSSIKLSTNVNNIVKSNQPLDRVKNKSESSEKKETLKQDATLKQEHFYTALFSNKQDVRVPKAIDTKSEIKRKDKVNKVIVDVPVINTIEQSSKKKKLNLEEYKQRRGLNSNNGSAQVSPESIFPEMPCNINLDKNVKMADVGTSNNVLRPKENIKTEDPKTVFDPIREASRKILMNSKIKKASKKVMRTLL